MSHSEYLFVCRCCKESKWVAAQDMTASLSALLCDACGDEREPIVRAMAEAPLAPKVLPIGAMRRMLVRWHLQV